MIQDSLLGRLRAEFLEMPGLRLTVPQAQYLCGVDRVQCQQMLDALVAARFLCVRPDGAYMRLMEEADNRRVAETPNLYLPEAELKALQDVFEAAETVDWAAYEQAKARIRRARLDTLRLRPVKADVDAVTRFVKAG